MSRILPGVVLLLLAAGCQKGPEALVQDQLAGMKEITTTLDGITDDASAEAAMPKLEKAVARLKAANLAASRTGRRGGGQPTPEEINRAMEMAKPLMEAGLAMTASAMKAQMKAPRHAARIAEILNSAGVGPR